MRQQPVEFQATMKDFCGFGTKLNAHNTKNSKVDGEDKKANRNYSKKIHISRKLEFCTFSQRH